MNTYESLRRDFANPDVSFRMMPLFRINDEIDPLELRRQIKGLKERGFGGVFSSCECFGESAPHKFTSDWWWKVVGWLVEACAAEGLQFWVYDDEDWPSGSVGGKLLEDHPERSWKYLHPESHVLAGPGPARIAVGPDPCLAAAAYRLDGERIVEGSLRDLSDRIKDGHLQWDLPEGAWTVTIYTAPAGKGIFLDGYGDLMDKQAMAAFVEMVYQTHWDRVRQIPGGRIQGYFTDEPAFSYSMVQWGERFHWYPSMPFSPELVKTFQSLHGYDPRPLLPLLYHDGGPQSLRLRCQWWEACCHMYSENYFGQVYRFCEEHGVRSSGHLVIEESFQNHLAQQAGNLPTHFRHMHIPGVDWIHPFESFKDWPATTPKYATSMAHLMGRERTWAETFAASGWGLTFQQMRWIVNWEHVNGINMQIPITYKYSMRGAHRTRFYPGGLTYHQPFWEHIRAFADYEARLCLLTSGLGHVAQLVLVYPSVDIWSHCWEHELLNQRSDEYNRLGNLIRFAGFDFDILDDQAILDQACVESGQLVTDTESFEAIVLPRMDAMRRATAERCLELARAGGMVILLGQVPRHSIEHGAEDPELAALMRELLGEAGLTAAAAGARHIRAVGAGRAGFAPAAEDIIALLREALTPDLQTNAERMAAYHRRLEDGKDLYLIYNYSGQTRAVDLRLATSGYPEILNAETGGVNGVEDYDVTPSGTRLRLKFHGHELIPVLLHPEKFMAALPRPERLVQEIPIPGPFRFRIEETMKRPEMAWNFTQREDGWTSVAAGPLQPPEKMPLGDWQKHGLRFYSGLGHYEIEVALEEPPAGGRMILNLGQVCVSAEVFVNEHSAGLVFFEPYEIDITDCVRPGVNQLRIVVANTLSNYFAQFKELDGEGLSTGGDLPERRVSGLLGPVALRIIEYKET